MQNVKHPKRYERNYPSISLEDQDCLAKATVAVVGCGGLGGFMAEELARLGVGRLILVDGDSHEETNLNRQLSATESTLGSLKVEALKERLAKVNSDVAVEAHAEYLTLENASSVLASAWLAMDALDSIPSRLMLERACEDQNLPLVFAAINGWYGMLGVTFPGDGRVAMLYGEVEEHQQTTSNPAFTPAVVASLAVAEALKVLLDSPPSLHDSWLQIDLLNMEFNLLRFSADE